MQQSIGFVNCLAKFFPNLPTICEPLRKLELKNESWKWQPELEISFNKVKPLATAALLFQFYIIIKEVTILCDASSSGLQAVLMQHRRPIAYASKGLTTTERNYSKIENQCIKNIFYVYIYIYIYILYLKHLIYITTMALWQLLQLGT